MRPADAATLAGLMPRLLSSLCSLALLLGCLSVVACDKGAARQCDERVGCPPPQTCDFGSNQCVGENDNVLCSSDANCSGENRFCDLAFSKCVPCLMEGASTECTGQYERWICKKTACESCGDKDGDCDGSLCLRSGGCAAPATVAVVTTNGTDNATCAPATPCATLAAAVASGRANIRLGPGTHTSAAAVVLNRAIAIYGNKDPMAARTKITRTGAGPIFDVSGGGKIELRDLELTGASGVTGHAITVSAGTPTLDLESVDLIGNAGQGIAAGAASLQVIESLVVSNAAGGISASGTVTLANNIVAKNGTASSAVGGLRLTSTAAGNLVRYNTIADNLATGAGTGVFCASNSIRLSSNIFAGNTVATCATAYSLFPVGTAVTAPDKAGDPKFIATTLPADRNDETFYHLMDTSAALSGGEPLTAGENDIDGDRRLLTPDIGADELRQ
jgi:hypothetical protein